MGLGAPLFAAGIIERGDCAVLICRSAAPSRPWSFPRVEVNAGESPEAAMRRLASEALNVEVVVTIGQPPVIEQLDGAPVQVRYFICHICAGEPEPHGYAEIRWVLPGQLCEYDFDPATQQVIEWYNA